MHMEQTLSVKLLDSVRVKAHIVLCIVLFWMFYVVAADVIVDADRIR